MTLARSIRHFIGGLGLATLLLVSVACSAQNSSTSSATPPEMIVTDQGFLAINTPQGWVRTQGPGIAFFVPDGVDARTADAWIYISGAPIGPEQEDKDLNGYIQSDVSGFKGRFKQGVVQKTEPLSLAQDGVFAPALIFRSGEAHNAYEEVVYIADGNRVLTLTLSAKNPTAFANATHAFVAFAKSYKGSIQLGSPGK